MLFKEWLLSEMYLPHTPENIALAKEFLLEKWKERGVERGFPKNDLVGACKFGSLFAQEIFGGELKGNWHHQFVKLGDQIIDLTDAIGVNVDDPHRHDDDFWGNTEHKDSMESCRPRVEKWVQEFYAWVKNGRM